MFEKRKQCPRMRQNGFIIIFQQIMFKKRFQTLKKQLPAYWSNMHFVHNISLTKKFSKLNQLVKYPEKYTNFKFFICSIVSTLCISNARTFTSLHATIAFHTNFYRHQQYSSFIILIQQIKTFITIENELREIGKHIHMHTHTKWTNYLNNSAIDSPLMKSVKSFTNQ